MDYVFLTDASCDMPVELIQEIGLDVIPMEFTMEDKSYLHYHDARMMSLDEFYSKLKSGVRSTTSQVNYNTFCTYFEQYLKAGKDVLYTGIASGISGTYNTSLMAINDLKKKYPDRKIISIDSTCDSLGLSLLLYICGQKYKDGCSIEELENAINEVKVTVCHWYVVDDLEHLKRGGRISAVTATFGKALQIKPLLSVNATGGLINVAKIRGTSNVINNLINRYDEDAINPKENIVFIAHADNKEGALEMQKRMKSKCKKCYICDIGPIIGSHVGAGLLAITFTGKRNLSE